MMWIISPEVAAVTAACIVVCVPLKPRESTIHLEPDMGFIFKRFEPAVTVENLVDD